MNLDKNTIIRCNLEHGFKLIKGLEEYDLLLIDNINILLNHKKEIKEVLKSCSGLFLYIENNINCNNLNYFNMILISKNKINNKYLYFYGHKSLKDNYYEYKNKNNFKNKIKIKIKEEIEEQNHFINLFNKDKILNFHVNRVLSKGFFNKSKINVLDLTRNEDLVQILVINPLYKVIILGCDKIKVRTTCAMNNKRFISFHLV